MRKPIIWTAPLAAFAVGAFLASCDSKGTSPTSSNTETTATTSGYTLSVTSPSAQDTTIPYATSKIKISGTVSPAKSGLSVKVGDSTATTKSDGSFAATLAGPSAGIRSRSSSSLTPPRTLRSSSSATWARPGSCPSDTPRPPRTSSIPWCSR